MTRLINSKYSYLGILFIGAVLFFQNASTPGFFHDGYLYAALGKNAVLKGNWLVPFLSDTNYPVFAEHPPFVFILEGLFFWLTGFDFFQARLFSGLWGLLLLAMLGKFSERYIGKGAGFFAGIVFLLVPFIIKKVRFPNLDIPLTFFILASVYFFIRAYEDSRWRDWLLCGVFFGLGLLTKGPPALFLPLSFLLYFIFKKDTSILMSLKPWLGLSLGIIIFLVWPMALNFNGQSEVFWMWWQRQITGTIVEGRETKELNVFTYFIDLLKIMPLHLLLLGFLIKAKKINFKNNAVLLSTIFMVVYLAAISLMKFKYSHYLLPIFPFGALILSSLSSSMSELYHRRFQLIMYAVGALILVASLVLPFGKEIKRDRFLVEVTQNIAKKNLEIKNILLHPSAYEYWAATNYFAYIHQANVRGQIWDDQAGFEDLKRYRMNSDSALVPITSLAKFAEIGIYSEIHRDENRGIVFILFDQN
jgi:4-amino-4-deoxy-L-arabinose transferase-like glycosyltransferase